MNILKNGLLEIFVILAMSIFIIVLLQPHFFNYHTISSDFFPLAANWRFHDSELFQKNDFIYNYMADRGRTLGEDLLSPIIFTPFLIPLAAKILQIILLSISALYLFRSGKHLKGKFFGVFLSLVFLAYSQTIDTLGGNIHAWFSFAILTYYFFHLIKNEKNHCLFGILLSGIIVPYLLPTLFLSFILYTQIDWKNKIILLNKSDILKVFLVFTISIIFAFPLLIQSSQEIGEPYTLEEFSQMEEFERGEHSSYSNFFSPPLVIIQDFLGLEENYHNGFLQINLITLFIIISFFVFLFILKSNALKIPKEVYFILFSSILSYIFVFISFFFAPLLFYFPVPYFKTVRIFFYVFFFAWNFWNISKGLKNVKIMQVSIVLLFLILFSYAYNYENDLVFCKDTELYAFIETTPKDSLIMGHPTAMDCVTMFGKRSIYSSEFFADARYRIFWDKMKERLFKTFEFLYSNKVNVEKFCKDEKIDYIVIHNEYYSENYLKNQRLFFKPFNSKIKSLIADKNFDILNKINEFELVYSNKSVSVYSCEKIVS